MQNFIVDYVNENEVRKKEKSVKKYNMLAYKKLMFEYYPALKEGKFMGVITSTNKAEGITKYDLKLPTDRTFSKVYGDIVDIGFPAVDPKGDSDYIDKLVDEYYSKISKYDKPVVMLQGEFTFTYRTQT